jgi:hypothetical protein
MPWFVRRPVVSDQILQGRNERIRLFLVCLFTTTYHFFWAYFIGGYHWLFSVPLNYYYYSTILENAMPYLLMLLMSRDIRSQWILSTLSKQNNRVVLMH